MGIQDRDWYREDYASKNGLRYNRRNATYSAQDQPVVVPESAENTEPPPSGKASPHWSLQLVVWLLAAAAFAAFYRYSL